jgi:hypothetical protein
MPFAEQLGQDVLRIEPVQERWGSWKNSS